MRLITLGLLLIPAIVAAEDGKQPPPTPSQRYEAIYKAYRKYEKAFFVRVGKLKTQGDFQKLMAERKANFRKTGEKMWTLARAHPKTEAAFKALVWLVDDGDGIPRGLDGWKALIRDHLERKELKDQHYSLRYHWKTEQVVPLLRTLETKSPHRGVRGIMLYTRALRTKDRQAKEKVLQRVVAEYPKVPIHKGPTLADAAKRDLFQMRKLQVGQPAPEIEGTDAFGKRFKLSDYRGKVVLLTFWGGW